MSKRGKSKIKLSAAKPDLPPFLQRIKEQLVANEDAERREESERKRRSRPSRPEVPDEAPTFVRVGDEEVTEEEFDKMKRSLETEYRLDNKKPKIGDEVDVDHLIRYRANMLKLKAKELESDTRRNKSGDLHAASSSKSDNITKTKTKAGKTLSYDSSSSDED